MTKIEIMYLCDRLADWYKAYAPFDEPVYTEDYWTQIAFKDNRKKLIACLNQTYEEMCVDTEEDEKLFKELGSILEELQKL